MSIVFLVRMRLCHLYQITKYKIYFTYYLRISVFCRTKATIVSELDILPVLYHQNGSFVDVMGKVFCSNTSGSPSVLSPVLAKASHVCLRLNMCTLDVKQFVKTNCKQRLVMLEPNYFICCWFFFSDYHDLVI